MTDQQLKNLIKTSFDLHVHIGPEIIPRRYDLPSLIKEQTGKVAGIAVKNHFWPTIAMSGVGQSNSELAISHSLTLNRYSGGFNADLIYAVSALNKKRPFIVWFSTLHTAQFLSSHPTEIPREWLDPAVRETMPLRASGEIVPLEIKDGSGKLKAEVRAVLKAIKDCGAVLATGHLSWREARLLVQVAVSDLGIEKIIITHPIYQAIGMPVDEQRVLAKLGAKIEHCYSMHTIDRIGMAEIAGQIKAVGAVNCFLSSDVGQKFSVPPDQALFEFAKGLQQEGISDEELQVMLVDNPQWLIG
jgi:hypothetical protein